MLSALRILRSGLILLLTCTLLAQVQTSPSPTKVPPVKLAPVKIKLTADQQRGLRLLKQAEAQAASLEPDMRAFVLWRVAVGYSKIDPAKSDRILHQAFLATQSIEQGPEEEDACQKSSTCRTKKWLQTGLLNAIMERSPDQALQLLPEADPPSRKQTAAALAELFTKKKDYAQALSLLTRIASLDQYPFETAGNLFLAMPKESPDRMTLFSQAQQNFEQFHSGQGFQGDFPSMLLRIWRQLPPPTVLSAVDDILQEGKDRDEKPESFHISFVTDNGSVSFNSAYQLLLFEMLPILDELDHERAQSLLRDNAEAQSMLAQFPQGMQSLDPATYQDHPSDAAKTHIRGIRMSVGATNPGQSTTEGMEDQIERQMSLISSEASGNPKQALADAMNLPVSNPAGPPGFSSPRVFVLMQIAKAIVEKNPSIAKSALDEAQKNLDALEPFQRGRKLSDSARLYLKLGETDSAKKCLDALQKAAEQAYKEDTDANDPNQAFKGQWPSAALWLADVTISARISSELAEQASASITDPEIAGATRVAYANELIGASNSGFDVARWHKNGQNMTMMGEN